MLDVSLSKILEMSFEEGGGGIDGGSKDDLRPLVGDGGKVLPLNVLRSWLSNVSALLSFNDLRQAITSSKSSFPGDVMGHASLEPPTSDGRLPRLVTLSNAFARGVTRVSLSSATRFTGVLSKLVPLPSTTDLRLCNFSESSADWGMKTPMIKA
jgi:hypothetical protein